MNQLVALVVKLQPGQMIMLSLMPTPIAEPDMDSSSPLDSEISKARAKMQIRFMRYAYDLITYKLISEERCAL